MPLWGATDSDESKPKNLTTAQKKQVFANASGWVLEAGSALSGNDNTSATPEVLVAIGELATSIGAADITEIEFVLVDDGSQDRTYDLLTETSKEDKRVKVVRFSRNFGHQAALLAGDELVQGDVIVSLFYRGDRVFQE